MCVVRSVCRRARCTHLCATIGLLVALDAGFFVSVAMTCDRLTTANANHRDVVLAQVIGYGAMFVLFVYRLHRYRVYRRAATHHSRTYVKLPPPISDIRPQLVVALYSVLVVYLTLISAYSDTLPQLIASSAHRLLLVFWILTTLFNLYYGVMNDDRPALREYIFGDVVRAPPPPAEHLVQLNVSESGTDDRLANWGLELPSSDESEELLNAVSDSRRSLIAHVMKEQRAV